MKCSAQQPKNFPNKAPRMISKYILPIALACCFALCGCEQDSKNPKASLAPPDLSILATSDLKDSAWLADDIAQATGVKVEFRFGTTMGSIESVENGSSGADAAWFANAKLLTGTPAGAARVLRQEKIATTPLVVGLCPKTAAELGWGPDSKVTWRDIANAAKAGKLRYAMSNPVSSNQGFMAVMGVAAAFSGKSEALRPEDVDANAAKAFFSGYKGVGDNSTYLAEKFAQSQCGELNAFINYESWLMSFNRQRRIPGELVLVYPHEGVATADYPFMLLNPAKAEAWEKVAAYLRSAPAQKKFALETFRRPAILSVAKDPQVAELFPKKDMVELTFSPDRKVADALMDAYLNDLRRPLASVFVLDLSSSMSGNGIADLRQSLHTIAGGDPSLAGRLAKLSSRERVWLLPFADAVQQPALFEIRRQTKAQDLDSLRAYADALSPNGNTALFDAAYAAIKIAAAEARKNPQASVSVVLFTDGANNRGMNLERFAQAWHALPDDEKKVPVFSIVYSGGQESELAKIAALSGGKTFDARKADLAAVFREIRAYQ